MLATDPLPTPSERDSNRQSVVAWYLFLLWLTFALSVYANRSFSVTNPEDFRYFPPFQSFVNRNHNAYLGGENLNIARALIDGRGFSDPFGDPTGPTAWMPPVFPLLLAGLIRCSGGDMTFVVNAVIAFQVATLLLTGVLSLILAESRGTRAIRIAAAFFIVQLLQHFYYHFQRTDDYSLVMLAIDGLIAGLCLFEPLSTAPRAAC